MTVVAVEQPRQAAGPSARALTVLHLLKTSAGGHWALRQMRELVRAGVRVHLAVPPGGQFFERFAEAGATVHPVNFDFPLRRPWRFAALRRALRALVDEVKPDLIHSHFVGTTLTMRLALGKLHATPRLFQVPGPLHLEHPFFRKAELATAGPRDHWMGSCRWTSDCYVGQGMPAGRVWLSYYGLDLEEVRAHGRGKLRRELGLSPEAPVVGMVAWMYPPKRYLGQRRGIKGHEDLIDAVAILSRSEPQLRCIMVGGAWGGGTAYEARVRAYARERCGDRVVFLGRRADVPELYPDFDVAVHPSHSENVGGAAESLLLGVPTVATNVGGFPDLVRPGETGWLVPPGDPEKLAKAVGQALADREAALAMARRGQALARELLDVRRTVLDVLAAYQKITGITAPAGGQG